MSYPPNPPSPPNKTNKALGYVIGGLVIGAALVMIILGGICAGFIYLLSQSHA